MFGIRTVGEEDDERSWVMGPPQLFLSFHVCRISFGFSFPRKVKSGSLSSVCRSRSNYVGSGGGSWGCSS